MTRVSARRRRAIATALMGFIVGGLLVAIEVWRGAPVQRAIGGFAILLAFAAVLIVFQTRSETVSTLAGDPVDERWRLIHERALAGAANVSAVVALAAFGIAEASGGDGSPFALMAIVIAVGYLVGLGWYRWRL
jgi:hypothetical protein